MLDVLPRLFDVVLVPPAVLVELARLPETRRPPPLPSFDWVRVQRPTDEEQVRRLKAVLDPGEAEAIALALELGAGILIDEAQGRAVASRLGLAPLGVLGILARCKANGWVVEIRPLMDRLQGELRFYISAALREEVLRSVGETADQ
jgi:predicted nucleic acid-binding protein